MSETKMVKEKVDNFDTGKIQRVETYPQSVKVSEFYYAFPERKSLLILRQPIFVLKHPWWFIEDSKGIIAVVGLEEFKSIWRLVGLLVLPARRNQGYGTLLVEHILSQAKVCGAPVKLITITPDYFSRFGFQVYDEPYKSGIVKMQWHG